MSVTQSTYCRRSSHVLIPVRFYRQDVKQHKLSAVVCSKLLTFKMKPRAEAASLFGEDEHPAAVPCYGEGTIREPSTPMWLMIQLFSIACMPAAYDMARDRGRSTTAWLNVALIFGPLALLALVILGKRNSEAVRTVP